jgi:tetratricopeptide (TPR) repeat protein
LKLTRSDTPLAINGLVAVMVVAWALLTVSAGPSTGQEWQEGVRVTGLVQNLDGENLPGATVAMRVADRPQEGPPPVITDERGRWFLAGLAPGRWEITFQADGYSSSQGWVTIPETGRVAPVEVRLRSLREVSPTFYEGDPSTIRHWLEKGNDLLRQGFYPEARSEYAKALPVMPAESRPEVLQSVARAYFLEGKTEPAVLTLQRALLLEPEDGTTRALLVALLDGEGRRREAEEFLDRLDREGPAASRVAEPEPDTPATTVPATSLPPEITDPPRLQPEPGRLGRYRVSFSHRSGLSGLDEYLERAGIDRGEVLAEDPSAGTYDLADETFYVYVPSGYRPAEPHGLLVWISPTPFGGFGSSDMQETLDRHRLIWIGADNSGNGRARWDRVGLALDAVHNMLQLYTLDERRIYAAGYSGGGRITTGLSMLYLEVFSGGLSVYGCDYFEPIQVPDKPGARWPARFPRPPRERLRRLKEDSRFVLLTGEWDFNRPQTQQIYDQMVADGFDRVTYLQVPEASHYDPPGAEWWDKAIKALDQPLTRP